MVQYVVVLKSLQIRLFSRKNESKRKQAYPVDECQRSVYILLKKGWAVQGMGALPSPAQMPDSCLPTSEVQGKKAYHKSSCPTIVSLCPRSATKEEFFLYFLTPQAGIVPYVRPGLIVLSSVFSGSTSPKTNSRCSPSPSRSLIARIRTGSLKMWSSVMPAHVFRSAAVGLEFTASAVTSAMESQAVELMPIG